MDFHLVIPAYKESERLPLFLPELARAMDDIPGGVRICVVDDGSGDKDQAAVQRLCAELRSTHRSVGEPLLLPKNIGKGGAVRAGWNHADKDARLLAFADADGAVSAEEIGRVFQIAQQTDYSTAVFGARIRMLGRTVERSGARHFSGRLFAAIVGTLVSHRVYDSQCGFKIVPQAAYRKIAPQLIENGFCFDVELLAALIANETPLLEVPVDWHDKSGSKVSLFRDGLDMATTAMRIRRRFKTWTF